MRLPANFDMRRSRSTVSWRIELIHLLHQRLQTCMSGARKRWENDFYRKLYVRFRRIHYSMAEALAGPPPRVSQEAAISFTGTGERCIRAV
jgi:hypothetical protein